MPASYGGWGGQASTGQLPGLEGQCFLWTNRDLEEAGPGRKRQALLTSTLSPSCSGGARRGTFLSFWALQRQSLRKKASLEPGASGKQSDRNPTRPRPTRPRRALPEPPAAGGLEAPAAGDQSWGRVCLFAAGMRQHLGTYDAHRDSQRLLFEHAAWLAPAHGGCQQGSRPRQP